MTSAGGPPPGTSGYAGPGSSPTAPAHAAPGGGGNGLAADVHTLERAIFEVKRIIVGQDQLVERMLVGLLSKGHVLLEGVPGVAKTLAVETFAKVVGGTFARIQFTPDLVPTDIIGTRIYRQGKEFDTRASSRRGQLPACRRRSTVPPAKVQSALLEVMQERRVSIGGKRSSLFNPFLVMATQNPIEHEGVYPLPEAQRGPLPVQGQRQLPLAGGRAAEIIYRMGVKPPEPKQILETGDPSCGCRRSRLRTSFTTRWRSTTWCGSSPPATPSNLGMNDAWRAGSRSAHRRVPRWASSPPRARWRWCVGATT